MTSDRHSPDLGRLRYETVGAAEEAIRSQGGSLAGVTLEVSGSDVLDGDGEKVGFVRGLTLEQVVPREFMGGEYDGTPAFSLRALRVRARVYGSDVPWPGSHRNVSVWWLLEDGRAVGCNENPSRGWSFPVVRLDEEEVRGVLESPRGVTRHF